MKNLFLKTTVTFILCLFLLSISVSSMAQVFRCGEPKGVAMFSKEGHKVVPDGFKGVSPVVIVEKNEMTVVWGDAKSAGGTEKAWKAVVIHRSPELISAVAVDEGPAGSAIMLYTVDVKRRYLYLSSHKENNLLDSSSSTVFVSKCAK